MSKRTYYGANGGTRNPFGSSGKRIQQKPLTLPSCTDEAHAGITAAAAKDEADTTLPSLWRQHASVIHGLYQHASR